MNTRNRIVYLSIVIVFALLGFVPNRSLRTVQAAPAAQGAEAITIDLSTEAEAEPVGPGDIVTFTIAVRNTGSSSVENVKVINNLLDKFLQIQNNQVRAKQGQSWEEGNSLKDTDQITWTIGELAPNQEWLAEYEAVIANPLIISPAETDTIAQTIPIQNEVAVYVNDASVANDAEILNVTLPTEGLTVVKELVETEGISPDGNVRLRLSVKNKTDSFVFNKLTISDEFTGEVAQPIVKNVFQLNEGSSSGEILNIINSNKIVWTMDSIRPGGEWFVEYVANMDAGFDEGNREIVNRASVLVEGEEVVKIAQSNELKLDVNAPAFTLKRSFNEGEISELRPGDSVTIVITYENIGTATATNVILEDSYDVNLVEEGISVENDGRVNGPAVVWDLGDLEPGSVREVSYKVKIKSDLSSIELSSGDFIEMTNQANIQADGVDPIYEENPQNLIVRTPIIRISELNLEDLNGGLVNPGDRLRITIGVENAGTAAAASLIVQAGFDNTLFTKNNISNDGTQEGGLIKWEINEIPAGGNKNVYYDLIVNSDVPGDTSANDDVVVFIGVDEIARSTVPIEIVIPPPPLPESSLQDIPAEQRNFVWIVAMIGGLILGSLGVLALASKKVFEDDRNKVGTETDKEIRQQNFQQVVQMFTVLIIVGAVLILAMVSELGPTPAVGVLSGIAGYVLGSRGK